MYSQLMEDFFQRGFNSSDLFYCKNVWLSELLNHFLHNIVKESFAVSEAYSDEV